ncbi:MAG: PilZ domain-containing protein [Nannocystaceae bacterium]
MPYGRPGDRRAFPRVQCALDCSVPEIGAGRLLNLSVGGAFVAFAGELDEPGERVRVRVDLDGAPIELGAEVVRSSAIAPRGTGFGVRFLDIAEDTSNRLHRFVLGRLLTEIAEVMEDNPAPLDPRSVTVTRGAEAVARALREALADGGDFEGALFQRDVAELVDVRLNQAGSQRLLVQVTSAPSAHPRVGDHVHLSLRRGHANLHFHTQVLDRSGAALTLEVPTTLTRFELRRAPRTVPGPGTMFVEIPVPFPAGRRLRREVLDISATGLAFRCGTDEVYFLPGTPLRELVIVGVKGGGEERRAAQVMHVTPVSGDDGEVDHLRVGVDFGIADSAVKRGVRPRPPAERKASSFLSRMSTLIGQLVPRRAAATQGGRRGGGPEIEVVRYANARREEIVAILNTTPREGGRRLRAPVIVIPPAHGKRKESTSGLALTLVENFARRGRDVVVLRYDGVRNLGESYKDPDCREHGREAMRMTLSQGVDDLEATLDYVADNQEFSATAIIVVSFSLQAVMGRRVLFRDRGRRIRHWIAVNGAPYARDLIANAAGGVDYLGQHQRGVRFGPASILGVTSDADHFAGDAVASGLAFAADAEREVPAIAAPITWILGRYDAWVDPEIVRGLMARPAKAARDVVELDCGHIPLNSDEAIQLFQSITRAIWRSLEGEEIEAIFPPWREIVAVRNAEWRRTPRAPLPDKRTYWAEYLLGGGDHKISYDVLYACDEYLRFLDRQAELLGVEAGHRVADMGCGTGNFFARYFERRGGRRRGPIARLTLVDFVPAALATAQRKVERFEQARDLLAAPVDARAISLELSPARSFRAFLTGEFYGYDPLKGTMKGLGDYSVEMWKAMDNWRLHDILRGRVLDDEDRSFLKESFPADEREVIVDVNRICRWLLGRSEAADLSREGRRRLAAGGRARFHDLRFARLESRDPEALERLPFADGSFDRLVSSLVLSYLDNPLETLREFHRCLAPGGRLVVSSMRPDVDMSRIYQSLLRRLERGDAVAIPDGISRAEFIDDLRAFLSSAAFLLTLAEEGHFAFFSRDELRHLVERAGFRRVETFEAFGDPPQAYVTVGYR